MMKNLTFDSENGGSTYTRVNTVLVLIYSKLHSKSCDYLYKRNCPLSMGVCIKRVSVERGSYVYIIVIFMCIQFLSDKQVVNCKFNSI